MKKIAFAVVLLTVAALAQATEQPLNPDRFPSVGLTYESLGSEGELEVTGTGLKQDIEGGSGLLVLDTRLPLSNSFTLDLALGVHGSQSELKAAPGLAAQESTEGGGYFRLGFRYYFNKGARASASSSGL